MAPPSARTSDDDLFMLLLLGVFSLGAAGTAAAVLWGRVLAWLLAHQVLVAEARHPLVALPYSQGAGLDVPRLALALAGALLLTVGAVRWTRRQLALRAAARELP